MIFVAIHQELQCTSQRSDHHFARFDLKKAIAQKTWLNFDSICFKRWCARSPNRKKGKDSFFRQGATPQQWTIQFKMCSLQIFFFWGLSRRQWSRDTRYLSASMRECHCSLSLTPQGYVHVPKQERDGSCLPLSIFYSQPSSSQGGF